MMMMMKSSSCRHSFPRAAVPSLAFVIGLLFTAALLSTQTATFVIAFQQGSVDVVPSCTVPTRVHHHYSRPPSVVTITPSVGGSSSSLLQQTRFIKHRRSSSSSSSSALHLDRGGLLSLSRSKEHHRRFPGVVSRALTRLKAVSNSESSDLASLSPSSAERRREYQLEQKSLKRMQVYTLLRVSLPSMLAGIVATWIFPGLAMLLASYMNDGVFAVLSQDSSQFVQNFLNVSSLLFSILVGQTYYFMYQQTENVYYALFNEVTEAKSLLEQVALVCQGRSMYSKCLSSIQRYVQDDLKQLHADPAVLLSARPSEDPLESIMYMTSVGVPSTVYETVRSLRQARASRLGALQRKLPVAHMWLLYILAAIELVSFPLLGAGTQSIGGYKVLTVEGILFGVMTTGLVLTLRVVGELWRPAGGAYNVDAVLSTMVRGLEDELQARMAGRNVFGAAQQAPSGARMEDNNNNMAAALSPTQKTQLSTPVEWTTTSVKGDSSSSTQQQQQGGNIFQAVRTVYQWIRSTTRRSSLQRKK